MSTGFMIAIKRGRDLRNHHRGVFRRHRPASQDGTRHQRRVAGESGPDVIASAVRALARPLSSRMPAQATGPLRQKLSRAGDPGNLTPAGFQAVRYALAAFFAIAGLTIGLVLRLPIPSLVLAPVFGALPGVTRLHDADPVARAAHLPAPPQIERSLARRPTS